MTIFDDDQKSMLDVYLYETNQLFEQLDKILIESEKQETINKEDIHSIFRIMHTTKSSSSMMGLDGIAELMHIVEDAFVVLRDDESKLAYCKSELFELLYDVSDFMHGELEHMKLDNYMPASPEELIHTSRTIQKKLMKEPNEVKQEVLPKPSQPDTRINEQDVFIRLRYEKESSMENIRAYMIISQIIPYCEKLESIPQKLENNPDAAKFIKEFGFFIRFQSTNRKKVLEMLHRALFVESCKIIQRDEFMAMLNQKNKNDEDNVLSKDKRNEEISSSVIPVQVKKLDKMQNLLGELMVAESVMMTRLEQDNDRELSFMFERSFHKAFMELEEIVMSARLIPISTIVPKLNRVIRDISHKEDKKVTFVVKGEDIEIDKEIVDHLFDPLMHLLRNAIDHGIEPPEERVRINKPLQGVIKLTVENNNGEITIHVEDDGRGLDVEKIRNTAKEKGLITEDQEYSEQEILSMIMMPGFSTKKQANEISGRGVGMDVVKNMVDQFRGNVSLSTRLHHGTRITMHLPLTLTIVESMLFMVGEHKFSIPSYNILRYFPYDIDDGTVQEDENSATFFYNGKAIPLIDLNEFFGIKKAAPATKKIIIYIHSSQREACIVMDKIIGYQHIVDKPLPSIINIDFKKATGISGCSLLGDGSICMSLNIEYLLDRCLGKEVGVYE